MRDHAVFKAGTQAFFQFLDVPWRTVAGEDHLFFVLIELVEGVEEFFFGTFFIPTAQELDVVYEEDIDIAVTAAETFRVLVLDTLDEFVDEVFTGDAQQAHVREVLQQFVADGVHQVGLAQAAAAVDVEGVPFLGRCSGNGLGDGCGDAVAVADDEVIKGIIFI